jgi:hypothetical protein
VSGDASGATDRSPVARVVHGQPTDEELAALITVLAARRDGGEAAAPALRRSEWANPARSMRRRHHHGPGGWRASAFPT